MNVIERCRLLSGMSEDPGNLTRTFLSPPIHEVHRHVTDWMTSAGMAVRVDAAGNLRGFYPALNLSAPRLLIGSHIDTVPNAGAFDGPLGVMLGIALVDALAGRRLAFGIEVIAFSEEEGVRFGVPFIGSRALVNAIDRGLLATKDKQGISLEQAIRNFGLDPDKLPEAAIEPIGILGYLEFHIEQGPVLESLALPVGIVTAIAGQSRLEVVFRGRANHAGTTPMHLRRDALAAAAHWITLVEREGRATPHLVATVGSIEALPGAGNVIAGEVRMSLDVRHAQDDVRKGALSRMLADAQKLGAERSIEVAWTQRLDQASVACDSALVSTLEKAVEATGLPVHRMVSGAGHDAMVLARLVPAAMLFVRSPGGISHHPDESVIAEDVDAALKVGLQFLNDWRQAMPDLVIRGGDIVTPSGVAKADIAIEDGQFSAIGPGLPAGPQEIDARGLTIFPGLIDVHLHFNEPGRTEWEGIATGSRALAAGGGTLFFDMPLNSSPCTLNGESFDRKHRAMQQSSITDFGLWGGLVPGNLNELDELAERGIIGFKAFMSDSGLPEFPRADELTLYEGMCVAARHDLPVAVHAESEELTKALSARIRHAGGTGVRDYLNSRPVLAELEAIQRAALLAKETGARLHIVHVSSGRGVALAAQLRATGIELTIETCPHYLFFTEDDMERLGAVAKCAPPLRPDAERESLWSALMQGEIDIVASDHSPSSPDLKNDPDFFRVWGGIAGVQSTLAVLLESGHHQRSLPLQKIAALAAATPAQRFRIANKGALEAGFDADCTLVDLNASFTHEANQLFTRHPLSPYVGSSFRGKVRRTICRGETIFRDGKITSARPGRMVSPHQE